MKNKTILIAETNKPQDKFIKEALIRNNVNVKIIDNIPINCRELMDSIISLKPDIVVTNERKTDGLASDVISEIQKNKNIKQPMFILVSGYSKNDMEYVVNNKGIDVHIIIKPYNFDDLAHYIKSMDKNDFYENWKEKYYNKRYIEIEKYLNGSHFNLLNKLGIKVYRKIYTEHEFEVMNMDVLAYYDDPKEKLSEEEKQYKKSLEGTNVTREEYNKVLNKLNEINNVYNL